MPRKIAAAYAIAGSLWILVSDRMLEALVSDPARVAQGQTAKGWLFVLLSTLLVYFLARQALRHRESVIADLKAGQQALAASEAELRNTVRELESLDRAHQAKQQDYALLFSANPQPMWIFDPETLDLLSVNDAAVAHYGYSREEWLGMRISDIRPAEDVPRLLENIKLRRSETFSDADVWTHLKKDGTPIQVEVSAHAMTYEGRAARVVTAIDVTERMRLQRALEDSEARYRNIFQSNHAVMLLIDPLDGRIVDANAAAERFYGYARAQLCQMPLSEINTLGQEEIEAEMAQARIGEKLHFEFRHRLASGEMRDVEVYSGLVPAGGRQTLLHSIIHDITEKRSAERALLDAEVRFQALVEQAVVGTYIVDDGVFTYASPRMEEIFGYQSGEMIGIRAIDIAAPIDQPLVAERIRRRMSGQESTARYQFTGRRKDGGEIRVEVHGTVADIGGRTLIIGVANDITALTEVEQRELAHLRRTEEAMLGTITIVSRMVEMRDPYTAGHERRVADIAAAIGSELKLSPERVEGLRIGASIHDIGKVAIPSDILSKPGKLSAIEYEYVKQHATAGFELLDGVSFPWPLAEMVHQHHERMNGSGYPRGLQGDQIMLEARILAVADTVEAMASHRPYRVSRGLEAALQEIEGNAGVLYDPEVVTACIRLFREQGYQLVE